MKGKAVGKIRRSRHPTGVLFTSAVKVAIPFYSIANARFFTQVWAGLSVPAL